MAEVEAPPAEDTTAAVLDGDSAAMKDFPLSDDTAVDIKPIEEAAPESIPEDSKPDGDGDTGVAHAAKDKQEGLKKRLAGIKSKKGSPMAASSAKDHPADAGKPPSDGTAAPERPPRKLLEQQSPQKSPLQHLRSPSNRPMANKLSTPRAAAASSNGASLKAGSPNAPASPKASPKGNGFPGADAAAAEEGTASTPTRVGVGSFKPTYKPKSRGLKRMIDTMGIERVEALMLEKDDNISRLQEEIRELKSQQRQAAQLAQKDKDDFDPKKQKSMAEEITFLRNALKKEREARHEAELGARKAVRAADEIKEAKAFSVKPQTGPLEPSPPPVGEGMNLEQLQRELQLKDATLQDLQRKMEVLERAKESSHRMHLLKEKEYKMHVEAARAEADATVAALAEKDKELRLACLQLKEAKAGFAPNPKSKAGRHLNPLSPVSNEDGALSPASPSPKGSLSLNSLSAMTGGAASPKALPGTLLPMPPKEKREPLDTIPAALKERRHSLEAANSKLRQKQPLVRPPAGDGADVQAAGDGGAGAALPAKPHLKIRTASNNELGAKAGAATPPGEGASPLPGDEGEEVDLHKYMPPWCSVNPTLTEQQYLTVQATWQLLREGNFDKFREQSLVRDGVHLFGMTVYDKLFQRDPRLRTLFSNKFRQSHTLISSFDKTLGMLPGSPRVAAPKGATKFAATPNMAGGMLPAGLGAILTQYKLASGETTSAIDPELVPVLQTLARKHVAHKVHYRDYGTMGEAVLDALETLLPAGTYTPEARTAWVALWSMMCAIMLPVHVRTCIQRQLPHLIDSGTHALEPHVPVDKGPPVLAEDLEDVSRPVVDIKKYLPEYTHVEPKLEFEQAQLVQDTWQAMKEGEYELFDSQHAVESATNFFGMCFYDVLFEMDPSLRSLFKRPFNQITMVTTAMDTAVSMLPGSPRVGFFSPKRDRRTPFNDKKDEPRKEHIEPELVPALQTIARKHAMYGIHYKDYATVGSAFIATLAKLLGPEVMDDTAKGAWVVVWSLMCSVMIPVHVDVTRKRKKGLIRQPSAIAKEAAEAEARQEATAPHAVAEEHGHSHHAGEGHRHYGGGILHHAEEDRAPSHRVHVEVKAGNGEEPREVKAHFGGQVEEIAAGDGGERAASGEGRAHGGEGEQAKAGSHGHVGGSHEGAPDGMDGCPVVHDSHGAEDGAELDAKQTEGVETHRDGTEDARREEGQGDGVPAQAAGAAGAHDMAEDDVRLDEATPEMAPREAEGGSVPGGNNPLDAPGDVGVPESEAVDQVAELQVEDAVNDGDGVSPSLERCLSNVESVAQKLARGSLDGDDGLVYTLSDADEN